MNHILIPYTVYKRSTDKFIPMSMIFIVDKPLQSKTVTYNLIYLDGRHYCIIIDNDNETVDTVNENCLFVLITVDDSTIKDLISNF